MGLNLDPETHQRSKLVCVIFTGTEKSDIFISGDLGTGSMGHEKFTYVNTPPLLARPQSHPSHQLFIRAGQSLCFRCSTFLESKNRGARMGAVS